MTVRQASRAAPRAAGSRQAFERAPGRQIGDRDDMHAGRAARLGEKHRPELAGTYEQHAQRSSLVGALLQHSVKIHCERMMSDQDTAGAPDLTGLATTVADHRS